MFLGLRDEGLGFLSMFLGSQGFGIGGLYKVVEVQGL